MTKKKKYYVIVLTVLFIWTNFVQPYFQDKIGVPVTAYVVSNVKELPEKASKVQIGRKLFGKVYIHINIAIDFYINVKKEVDNHMEKKYHIYIKVNY